MITDWVPTNDFAKKHHVKPTTIIAAHCRTGSYFGIKPKKTLNGRLLWPVEKEQSNAS